jgi:hypothetical protein
MTSIRPATLLETTAADAAHPADVAPLPPRRDVSAVPGLSPFEQSRATWAAEELHLNDTDKLDWGRLQRAAHNILKAQGREGISLREREALQSRYDDVTSLITNLVGTSRLLHEAKAQLKEARQQEAAAVQGGDGKDTHWLSRWFTGDNDPLQARSRRLELECRVDHLSADLEADRGQVRRLLQDDGVQPFLQRPRPRPETAPRHIPFF